MKTTVQDGQTIYDLAVQHYGSMYGVTTLIQDNPRINLSDKLSGEIDIREEVPPNLNRQNALDFRKSGIVVNSNDKQLNFFWEMSDNAPWEMNNGDTWDL